MPLYTTLVAHGKESRVRNAANNGFVIQYIPPDGSGRNQFLYWDNGLQQDNRGYYGPSLAWASDTVDVDTTWFDARLSTVLGTAAFQSTGYFATAAQGASGASAVQPGDNVSTLTNNAGYVNAAGASAAAPVQTVNGYTGTVVLAASDVGAETPAGATSKANAAQAYAIQRSNHTGTQLAATISDLGTAVAAASPVSSVAGKTGVVSLVKADVGLSNVDNTADSSKPVSTAQASADSAVQAYAVQRTNHTGTQAASTITGLATVATTGAYNDLSGKPTIPAAQVQSDWTAVSGLGVILNKPTLFNGAYSSLTGIPSTFAPSAHNQAWSTITSTPTTLSGYGITDPVALTSGSYANPSWITSLAYSKLTGAPTIKRQETYSGTSNGSGVYSVTFGTAYSVAPNIQVSLNNGTDTQTWRVTSITTTGFSVLVRNRVDVIGLLPTYANVSGAALDVLITEK